MKMCSHTDQNKKRQKDQWNDRLARINSKSKFHCSIFQPHLDFPQYTLSNKMLTFTRHTNGPSIKKVNNGMNKKQVRLAEELET